MPFSILVSQLSSSSEDRNGPATPIVHVRLLFIAVCCCAGLTAVVVWLSHHSDTSAVTVFSWVSAFQITLGLVVLTRFQRGGDVIPLWYVIGSAVLIRAIGFWGTPLFEDDFHRYLFDGYMTATTGDPYSLPPSSFFSDGNLPEKLQDILSQINFPDIATVYGPVTQWFFAAAWLISPGAVWPFQFMAGVADVIVLVLIARLCTTNTQRNFLILYAWSPLLVKEFVMTAHPDVYAIALCLMGLLAAFKQRWHLCGLLLALAVGAKVFALLLVPLVLYLPDRIKTSMKILVGFIAGIVGITLAFGSLSIWYPEGLGAMAAFWIFNAPLYTVLIPVMSVTAIKMIALGVLSVIVCWRMWKIGHCHSPDARDDDKHVALISGCLWVYTAMLLCLPALNPWYVCWILPFAVLTHSRWSFIWAGLIILGYHTGIHLGGETLYKVPDTLIAIQFLGLLVALLTEWRYPSANPADSDRH